MALLACLRVAFLRLLAASAKHEAAKQGRGLSSRGGGGGGLSASESMMADLKHRAMGGQAPLFGSGSGGRGGRGGRDGRDGGGFLSSEAVELTDRAALLSGDRGTSQGGGRPCAREGPFDEGDDDDDDDDGDDVGSTGVF